MNIGENIKKYRKIKNMTQKELSEKSGLSILSIKKYESNKTEPTVDSLIKISKALDIDLSYLLDNYIDDLLSNIFSKNTNNIIDPNKVLNNMQKVDKNIISNLNSEPSEESLNQAKQKSIEAIHTLIAYGILSEKIKNNEVELPDDKQVEHLLDMTVDMLSSALKLLKNKEGE